MQKIKNKNKKKEVKNLCVKSVQSDIFCLKIRLMKETTKNTFALR